MYQLTGYKCYGNLVPDIGDSRLDYELPNKSTLQTNSKGNDVKHSEAM